MNDEQIISLMYEKEAWHNAYNVVKAENERLKKQNIELQKELRVNAKPKRYFKDFLR